MAYLSLQLGTGITGNGTALAGYLCALMETLGILCLADFSGRCLGKNVQGQFNVSHIIAEALFLQPLKLLILLCGLAAPTTSNDVGQRSILEAVGHSHSTRQ